MMLAQLRHYDYTLEDPLIDSWLDTLGTRLAANSDKPQQPFTFFMLRERQINAFATLGGYVGMNSGLVLAAEHEDEVAAVLSHEIAHVTQQHVLRGVERAQRDQLPILLAMLGAVVAAQASDSNSSDDAVQAAIVGAQGLMSSARSTTRAPTNPRPTASASRHSPAATTIRRRWRGSSERSTHARAQIAPATTARLPDYLMTHPVTTTRISEAKSLADQIARAPAGFTGRHRQRQSTAAGRPEDRLGHDSAAAPASSITRANACACSAPTARRTPSANTNDWPRQKHPPTRSVTAWPWRNSAPTREPPPRRRSPNCWRSIPATCG